MPDPRPGITLGRIGYNVSVVPGIPAERAGEVYLGADAAHPLRACAVLTMDRRCRPAPPVINLSKNDDSVVMATSSAQGNRVTIRWKAARARHRS